jgi:hypothetical protein
MFTLYVDANVELNSKTHSQCWSKNINYAKSPDISSDVTSVDEQQSCDYGEQTADSRAVNNTLFVANTLSASLQSVPIFLQKLLGTTLPLATACC